MALEMVLWLVPVLAPAHSSSAESVAAEALVVAEALSCYGHLENGMVVELVRRIVGFDVAVADTVAVYCSPALDYQRQVKLSSAPEVHHKLKHHVYSLRIEGAHWLDLDSGHCRLAHSNLLVCLLSVEVVCLGLTLLAGTRNAKKELHHMKVAHIQVVENSCLVQELARQVCSWNEQIAV